LDEFPLSLACAVILLPDVNMVGGTEKSEHALTFTKRTCQLSKGRAG
jgi:hypothetical protein